MEKNIDFYFDFLSPFAYLAHRPLTEIAQRQGYAITYKPIDLLRAKLAAGNDGPRNLDIPPKIKYLTADLQRWAERYGVPLEFPTGMDSERMNIGTLYALQHERTQEYVDAGFSLGWGKGGDMGTEQSLASLAEQLGWQTSEFLSFIHSAEARAQYETLNIEAHAQGVFGVPMMIVEDAMWWGNDRLEFLEEFLVKCAA